MRGGVALVVFTSIRRLTSLPSCQAYERMSYPTVLSSIATQTGARDMPSCFNRVFSYASERRSPSRPWACNLASRTPRWTVTSTYHHSVALASEPRTHAEHNHYTPCTPIA